MKYKCTVILCLIIIGIIVSWFIYNRSVNAPVIPNVNRPISYSGNANLDLIKDISIKAEEKISSPLKISGRARGIWYFEADFPVFLTDGDGLIIAQGIAQAQSDWMTTEFVPFQVNIEFTKPASSKAYGNRGTLIFKNDNPSGDPERDMAVEIPVRFK